MSDIDIHHLGAAYALDALDARERAAFEAHYHDCDICRADVAQFRETLADLAAGNPIGPPDSVKQRVMADIARTRQLSPLLPDGVADLAERRRRRGRVSSTLLAAVAAVALVVAGTAIVVSRGGQPAYAKELAAVLSQPDGQVVTLRETGAGEAGGSFKVAWSSSEARLVVLGDALDRAPSGRAYELWLIDGSGAHPMRVLDSADDGDVRTAIELTGEPTAWGITIEPEEGSPTPTGDVIFLAEIQL